MNEPKKRILFADDDDDLRFAVKEHFSESNWKWDFAENGVVALDLALKHCYDLIILDVKMPFMKGNEAARDIKMKWPDVPIIAFTALPDYEERQKIMKDGFSEVVSKPIALKTFQKKIESHLYPERNRPVPEPPKPAEPAKTPPPKTDAPAEPEASVTGPSEKPNTARTPPQARAESAPPAPPPLPSDPAEFTYAFLRNKPIDHLIMTIQRLEKERRSLSERLHDLEDELNRQKNRD
jgi:DNA-binding response OmpR family regulator